MKPILNDTAVDMLEALLDSARDAQRHIKNCTGAMKHSYFHGCMEGNRFKSIHAFKMFMLVFGKEAVVAALRGER